MIVPSPYCYNRKKLNSSMIHDLIHLTPLSSIIYNSPKPDWIYTIAFILVLINNDHVAYFSFINCILIHTMLITRVIPDLDFFYFLFWNYNIMVRPDWASSWPIWILFQNCCLLVVQYPFDLWNIAAPWCFKKTDYVTVF